jgi:hypothetical protein
MWEVGWGPGHQVVGSGYLRPHLKEIIQEVTEGEPLHGSAPRPWRMFHSPIRLPLPNRFKDGVAQEFKMVTTKH